MLPTEPPHLIVLFGDTLFMTGVETALNRRLSQAIVRLRGPQIDLSETIRQLLPDLILFDLEDPQADRLVLLLKAIPDIRLIGLDRSRQATVILAGQSLAIDSMDELAQAIQARLTAPDRVPMAANAVGADA